MESAASLFCSKVTPLTSAFSPNGYLIPFTPFNKQFQRKTLSLRSSLTPNNFNDFKPHFNCNISAGFNRNEDHLLNSDLSIKNSRFIQPFRLFKCCASSIASNGSDSENPLLESVRRLYFEPLKSTISQWTPLDVCKLCLLLSVAIYASKQIVGVLFNPFFWTYFSWTWLFWPWMVAIGLAVSGLYCLIKHLKGESNLFQQLVITMSAFTWLTLVPPAHFNGFLEGWPFVFFLVYHYFFFLNISVRKRLYGDYYPREHDNKWDISLPNWQKLLFCVGVNVGHWLAAFEGPELHLVPGGWNNVGIWGLIMITIFMQYHSTLYLAKYSEKVVVPTAVVQFGPYRFVRHPIYASTMLLFVTYFIALRAPLSSLFVIAVCLLYYGQKAKLEEALMLETFKERYSEYMSKVRYKLIPFVY